MTGFTHFLVGRKPSPVFLKARIAQAGDGAESRDGKGLTEQGYLGRSGSDWQCNRGYRKQAESCIPVELPPNGYLDSSGQGWDCERGFKRGLRTCLPLAVPRNAHVASSGSRWTCDPGFRRDGPACTKARR